jgi:hypothetical protein
VELVKDVRKLAVLRANALGDYLVSLPAILALRAAYPAAEMVLLGAGWHAGLLAGRPGPVDRCLAVPPTAGVRDDRPPSPPATVDRFFARMRAERFDLAVQLQGGRPPFQPVRAPVPLLAGALFGVNQRGSAAHRIPLPVESSDLQGRCHDRAGFDRRRARRPAYPGRPVS